MVILPDETLDRSILPMALMAGKGQSFDAGLRSVVLFPPPLWGREPEGLPKLTLSTRISPGRRSQTHQSNELRGGALTKIDSRQWHPVVMFHLLAQLCKVFG